MVERVAVNHQVVGSTPTSSDLGGMEKWYLARLIT